MTYIPRNCNCSSVGPPSFCFEALVFLHAFSCIGNSCEKIKYGLIRLIFSHDCGRELSEETSVLRGRGDGYENYCECVRATIKHAGPP